MGIVRRFDGSVNEDFYFWRAAKANNPDIQAFLLFDFH